MLVFWAENVCRLEVVLLIRYLCILSVVFLAQVAAPQQSFAQSGKKQMTEEQIRLLNKANNALYANPEDLDTAHEAIRAALQAGDRFDVLLLTLGRVLQKQDNCSAAKRAFGEINRAPHESSIPKEDITRLKERYIEQMGDLCSAELTLECTSPETTLEISGQTPACGSMIKLPPGGYQLIARLGTQEKSYDIELEGAQERSFAISLVESDEPETVVKEDTSPEPEVTAQQTDPRPEATTFVETDTGFRQKRALASGITTVLLAGGATGLWFYAGNRQDAIFDGYVDDEGFWLDDVPEQTRTELEAEGNRWGRVQVGSGVAIPVVAATGTLVTVLFAIADSSPKASSGATFNVAPRRDGAQVMFGWRW